MALRRDKNGNVTGEQFVTEAQQNAQLLYQQRLAESIEIQRKNMESRSKRTPRQQIDRLDKLLGVGVGARKERKRLMSMIKT